MKNYNLAVVVVPDKHEEGPEAFQAYCPDIEEAVTWGDTREEALSRINELLPDLVKLRIERGIGETRALGPIMIGETAPTPRPSPREYGRQANLKSQRGGEGPENELRWGVNSGRSRGPERPPSGMWTHESCRNASV